MLLFFRNKKERFAYNNIKSRLATYLGKNFNKLIFKSFYYSKKNASVNNTKLTEALN